MECMGSAVRNASLHRLELNTGECSAGDTIVTRPVGRCCTTGPKKASKHTGRCRVILMKHRVRLGMTLSPLTTFHLNNLHASCCTKAGPHVVLAARPH